jgi:hypothetical protein
VSLKERCLGFNWVSTIPAPGAWRWVIDGGRNPTGLAGKTACLVACLGVNYDNSQVGMSFMKQTSEAAALPLIAPVPRARNQRGEDGATHER